MDPTTTISIDGDANNAVDHLPPSSSIPEIEF